MRSLRPQLDVNLDRQIKRRLLAPPHRALIHPGPGCARAVEAEVAELLRTLVTPEQVRTSVRAAPDGLLTVTARYRTLLELVVRLTTAQDVSLLIGEGAVHNRRDLATLLESIDWRFFLRSGDRVFLRRDSRASTLYHEGIVGEVVSERLAREGVRLLKGGESDRSHVVTVRIDRNNCRVLLSLAGAPLWKRGYRGSSYAPAPLREDLAQSAIRAAVDLAASSLQGRSDRPPQDDAPHHLDEQEAAEVLLLPFAGSGTLLFEYLIARLGIPPFVFREGYAFERFAVPPPRSVSWVKGRLLEALSQRLSRTAPVGARLVDRDPRATASVAENLRRFESLLGAAATAPAGLPLRLESMTGDAFARPWSALLPDGAKRVFLPMNPPYGRRLAARSAEELYRRIGRATAALAESLPAGGLHGFVLCPSQQSWRAFLGASGRLEAETSHLSHGGIDLRLCRFTS